MCVHVWLKMSGNLFLKLLLIFMLYFEIHGVSIIEQPYSSVIIPQGQPLSISFNYSLSSAERAILITYQLKLNGTVVFGFSEFGGNIIQNRTSGHFASRSDIHTFSIPQSYFAFTIQATTFSDSGEYVWNAVILGSPTVEGKPINVIVGSEPRGATLIITHQGGLSYVLECHVTGAIPLPNITIWNGTEVLHEAPSVVSTSFTMDATFQSEYSCTGVNVLGSLGSNKEMVPQTTTESPTTTPLISSTYGRDTASTDKNMPDTTQTGDRTDPTSPPVKDEGPDDTPTPIGLIVGVAVGGTAFLIVVIGSIVYVCVCKVKTHRTDPDKERVAATTENQYSETPMNDTKCQPEQEEKQQRNVEGLQYADLDLRPTGKTKPAGGRNNLVIDEDSKTEYAEVRKT